MPNTIAALRAARGWSQQDLATAAGTSQQQIARIESESQSVRLDLAAAIAQAFGVELHEVFPEIRRPRTSRTRRRQAEQKDDGSRWLLALRFRGGAALDFVVSSPDRDRLRSLLRRSAAAASPFFVFHTKTVHVALNLDLLAHYQELWDGTGDDDWHDERVPTDAAAIFLADAPEPLTFEVGPESGVDDLLATLDAAVTSGEFVSFRDADGEEAFFRVGDVALFSFPTRSS